MQARGGNPPVERKQGWAENRVWRYETWGLERAGTTFTLLDIGAASARRGEHRRWRSWPRRPPPARHSVPNSLASRPITRTSRNGPTTHHHTDSISGEGHYILPPPPGRLTTPWLHADSAVDMLSISNLSVSTALDTHTPAGQPTTSLYACSVAPAAWEWVRSSLKNTARASTPVARTREDALAGWEARGERGGEIRTEAKAMKWCLCCESRAAIAAG